MLILVETAAGYGIFTITRDSIVDVTSAEPQAVADAFDDAKKAKKSAKLAAWAGFKDNQQAMDAANCLTEGTIDKTLKKLLKKTIVDAGLDDQLAVLDRSLGMSTKFKNFHLFEFLIFETKIIY
jgi:nucleolar protein 58